jgi:FMN reductase
MKVGVLIGNPKRRSRTLEAGVLVAKRLTGSEPTSVIDLVDFGSALLEFGNTRVVESVQVLQGLDVLIVASPTYKATYTGLLKLYLDQIPSDGLAGIVALPLMLGAGPSHALAPELHLKPVLVESGSRALSLRQYVCQGCEVGCVDHQNQVSVAELRSAKG